jgi:hypothetical protein
MRQIEKQEIELREKGAASRICAQGGAGFFIPSRGAQNQAEEGPDRAPPFRPVRGPLL